MKTLLPILKTKLFLLGFVSACTVILATTVPQLRNFIAPEKAIGEKITTEQKKIAPKIKTQNKTVSASRVTSGFTLGMNNSFDATLTSDKEDYAPGETATLTGSGFLPGETVTLQVVHADHDPDGTDPEHHEPWTVIAEADGSFVTTWWVPDDGDAVGATLKATADGEISGLHAEVLFTDALNTQLIDIIPPSGSSGACGSTLAVSARLQYDPQGSPVGDWTNVSGATVTFTLGANSVNAVTGGDGVASTTIIVPGGATTLIVDFAGSGSGGSALQGAEEEILFTVTGTPTATLPAGNADDQTICPGENGLLSIALTGSGTISGTLTGGIPFSGTDGTIVTVNVSPIATTTFEILTVTNGTCNGTFSGDTKISVKGKATADAGDDETYCVDEIELSGSANGPGNSNVNTLWTTDGDGIFDNPQDATTGYNPGPNDIINGSVVLTLTASGPGICDGVDDITVTIDKTLPTISASGTTTDLGCNPLASDINAALGSASASDNCGTPTVSSSDGNVSSDGCSRTQTRTFTATDNTNGTATTSRTVTWVVDITPPEFTGSYTEVDLGCNPIASDITAALGTATATDGCGDPTVTVISTGSVTPDGCIRTQTRTFLATDGCTNTNTVSRTVRWVVDITPPEFTGSYTEVDLGCNPIASDITASLGTATATDGCGDPTVTVFSTGSVTPDGCIRTQTRTFLATDGCTNTNTVSRTVRWVVDITPPEFTGSYTEVDLGCNPIASDITASLGTATATDGCGDPTVTVISTGSVTPDGCIRTQTRTFLATDGCTNTNTVSRTVRWVVDITPPEFTGSYTEVDLGCNPIASDITASLGTATATDGCGDPTVTVFSTGSVTPDGCIRTQTRTFLATDGCTNTNTVSRTVRWVVDITPPEFTGSYTEVDLGCNPIASDITAALGTATATDGCGDPTVTVISTGSVTPDGCIRTQTRTFLATDGCTNTNTVSRTVRWVVDITPPEFTGSYTEVDLGCNPIASDITASLGTATATDGCGDPTVTVFSTGSVTPDGCIRTQTRTFLATDGCTNTNTVSRTVRWVVDITPPEFTGSYTEVDLGCNPIASDITVALGTATATDGCGDPTVTVISTGSVIPDGCIRTQTRTFLATDGCTNTNTVSRTVRWVVDITPPEFTGSYTEVDLGCNPIASDITAALGTATATDGCGDPTVTVISTGSVTPDGCIRTQTRTFLATDGCTNTNTVSRTVRWVVDITPPEFTGSYTEVDLGCNPIASDITAALGTATATDGCGDPTVTVISTGSVIPDGCIRTQTRTFLATDGCTNTNTVSRTVKWVVDVTPPEFTGSYTEVDLGCNPIASDITAALGTATATDGCGDPTITSTDGSVLSSTCSRSKTRTFTAKDGCNNTSTVSRTVRWTEDTQGPDIGGSTDNFVSKTSLWPPNHKMVDIELAVTDACGLLSSAYVSVTSSEPKNDIGDGNTEPDMAWNGSGQTDDDPYTVAGPVYATNGKFIIQLRAERSGVKALNPDDPGRTYTVNFTATDACGNTTTATNTVTVAHNITNPKPGASFPINTVVNLSGTFWDVPGNKHTAKWVVDATTVNGTVTAEPNGNKLGKVTGSFKPTVAGVYKLRMNVTDQKGVTSYATTSGDYEAYFVAYDPKGGYTYGAGQYISPAGALTARPQLSEMVKFGFTSNYYKNATNPKGETQIDFKLTDGEYSFGFNALNYDYLAVNGTKAVYKGLGKTITNGIEQSGLAFILTVIDGKNATTLNGVDKIRMKIYNKNSGAIIYDNQMGDPETADPTMAVDSPQPNGCDIVVVSTPATSVDNSITRSAQMEAVPAELGRFNVRAFPNPSQHVFSLVLENATNEKVKITVYDAIGRQVKMFEKQSGNIPIHFGMDLKVGAYIVEVRQGDNRKTLKLVKQ